MLSCVACGHLVLANPERLRSVAESDLYALLINHVSDNTWSVRENAAVAFGQLMKLMATTRVSAWRLCSILPFLRVKRDQPTAVPENCKSEVGSDRRRQRIERQLAESARSCLGNLTDLRSSFIRAAEDPEHSDKQMYSCGSLAPKLKRGRRGVGCMDHGYCRPKEPWEDTDGCVYLVRELSRVAPGRGANYLPKLAAALESCFITPPEGYRVARFAGAETLEQTIWKQLPAIAELVGKRAFKRHIEDFPASVRKFTSWGQSRPPDNAVCVSALLSSREVVP